MNVPLMVSAFTSMKVSNPATQACCTCDQMGWVWIRSLIQLRMFVYSDLRFKFNIIREGALQQDFDLNSVTGLGCVWLGSLHSQRWVSVAAVWTQMSRVDLSRTLRHPGLSGCCTDQCDDKWHQAWHLNVESLLALTDLVSSGVGQNGLVGFICNMSSFPGFSVGWRQNGAAAVRPISITMVNTWLIYPDQH